MGMRSPVTQCCLWTLVCALASGSWALEQPATAHPSPREVENPFVAADAHASNLVRNGDFANKDEVGLPVNWTVGGPQKVTVDSEATVHPRRHFLRVDVVVDGGSSYGQVYQNIKAKPNTLYVLQGETRSTKAELAFFSIKLRRDGREIKRIGLPKSRTEWSATNYEFSSEDADEIQVLCRWRQSAERGWVGHSGWFSNISLVEKGPAPPPPPWKKAIRRAAEISAVSADSFTIKPTQADIYVTPNGAGGRDGSGWENALPGNAHGVLQAAWDALAPGQACRVGSGTYVNVELKISSGGTGPDKLKTLVGEDTGGGPAWFVGNWNPDRPAEGNKFIVLTDEIDYCRFENLKLARYRRGIGSMKGRHVGLRIKNVDVYEGRFGIFMQGLAYADEPEVGSHDIVIEDCEFMHFTKSGIRLQGGNYDFKIINCVADAGGTDWMKESFHICYNLLGEQVRRRYDPDGKPWAAEHDVIFINCVARNAIYSRAKYWQGDGFIAEGDVRNVAYINCESYDNADGGWDVKAENVVFVNCIGMRSKMNWRLWRHGFLYNCLSAYSFKRGGSWISAGLWTVGDVYAERCTFHNNNLQQISADRKEASEGHPARQANVQLEKCIVSFDGENSETERLYNDDTRIGKMDVGEWCPKRDDLPAAGLDPRYVAAAESKTWDGRPAEAFDSELYNTSRGFHSSTRDVWQQRSTDELVDVAQRLLKHKGWTDFKQIVETFTQSHEVRP